jgi:hypothetical protein
LRPGISTAQCESDFGEIAPVPGLQLLGVEPQLKSLMRILRHELSEELGAALQIIDPIPGKPARATQNLPGRKAFAGFGGTAKKTSHRRLPVLVKR